jgi:hypothetical protein
MIHLEYRSSSVLYQEAMDFNKLSLRKYQHIQAELQKVLGKEVGRVSVLLEEFVSDLAQAIEPGKSKRFLHFALDLTRPYLQSLGLRTSRLTTEEIEVVLPGKILYQDSQQRLDAGAVVSASLFAYRRLWKKNAPKGAFSIKVLSFEFEELKPLLGSLFIRVQLPPLQREAVYSDLAGRNFSTHEGIIQIFDQQDQVVAKMLVRSELRAVKILDWK